MIQERRHHFRYGALNLLHFSTPPGDQPVARGMGRTLNVSLAGLTLETHIPVDPGESIAVTLELGEDLVVIEGQVSEEVWIMGIRFGAMPETSRQVLQHYIAAFQS